MKADAVIVAAGRGKRFIEGKKKQFCDLSGKPILAWTIEPFEVCSRIRSVYLVVCTEDIAYCRREIVERYGYGKVAGVVPGGRIRQESVRHGLDALPKDSEIVLIHDGVRPLITPEMLELSVEHALRHGAVVFGVPVKDTVKTVDQSGRVTGTPDRNLLWQIQTPQTFRTELIKDAFLRAEEAGFSGTDDASLVERLGKPVYMISGSYRNIKITTQEDLAIAEVFLKARESGSL